MNRLHRWGAVGFGLIISGFLVGCAGAQGPVPSAEAQEWLDQLDFDDQNMVAAFSGSPAPDFDAAETTGVGYESGSEAQVTSAEFSCVSEERMSVELRIEGADGTTTLREDDLLCDASPHAMEVVMDAVTSVRANAVSADSTGAWALVVRGKIS